MSGNCGNPFIGFLINKRNTLWFSRRVELDQTWIQLSFVVFIFRFGQYLVSTLPAHPSNENELKLDLGSSSEATTTEGEEGEEILSPRRICLRNVMLELILCLIYAEGGELDHR